MANTTFKGAVRSENGFKSITISSVGAVTVLLKKQFMILDLIFVKL